MRPLAASVKQWIRSVLSRRAAASLVILPLILALWFISGKVAHSLYPISTEIRISPRNPTAQDNISVRVSGDWSNTCVPEYDDHVVTGQNQVIIDASTPDAELCNDAITSYSFTADVGRLEPGDYEACVFIADRQLDVVHSIGCEPFTVQGGGEIWGIVFEDLDQDGVNDPNESGLPWAVISLRESPQGGDLETYTTGNNGRYEFSDVEAGTYYVVESDPSDYTSTTPNSVRVEIGMGDRIEVNFGDTRGATAVTVEGFLADTAKGCAGQTSGWGILDCDLSLIKAIEYDSAFGTIPDCGITDDGDLLKAWVSVEGIETIGANGCPVIRPTSITVVDPNSPCRCGDGSLPPPTRTPRATPRPTNTPWPTNTPRSTNTPWPTNTPRPTNTPIPTTTPVPTPTPTPIQIGGDLRPTTMYFFPAPKAFERTEGKVSVKNVGSGRFLSAPYKYVLQLSSHKAADLDRRIFYVFDSSSDTDKLSPAPNLPTMDPDDIVTATAKKVIFPASGDWDVWLRIDGEGDLNATNNGLGPISVSVERNSREGLIDCLEFTAIVVATYFTGEKGTPYANQITNILEDMYACQLDAECTGVVIAQHFFRYLTKEGIWGNPIKVISNARALVSLIEDLAGKLSGCLRFVEDMIVAFFKRVVGKGGSLGLVSVASPVYPMVQGRDVTIGWDQYGNPVGETSNLGFMIEIDHYRYIVFDRSIEPDSIQLVGYDEGTFDLSVVMSDADYTGRLAEYHDVSVNDATKGVVLLSDDNLSLRMDRDGDGAIDEMLEADVFERIRPTIYLPMVAMSSERATQPEPTPRPPGQGEGGQIIFSSGRGGNPLDIYIMDKDGSNVRRLTNAPGFNEYPKVSRDGRRVVFQSTRTGSAQAYIMNIDGTNVRQLTTNCGSSHGPSWSPDGTRIAFVCDGQLAFINPDGTQFAKTETGGEGPDWSPDGTKIVFTRWMGINNDWEILVVNPDGSHEVRLTHSPGGERLPSWSPDGLTIAFCYRTDLGCAVYTMNADGSNRTRLADGTTGVNSVSVPRWSPNGQHIVFTSDRDGNREIYLMDASGSNQRRLTHNPARDDSPFWFDTSGPTTPLPTATPPPVAIPVLELVGHYNASGENGLYVSGGYAFLTTYSGLYVVDVSNPRTPTEVSFFSIDESPQSVYVANSHAYVAAGLYGGLRTLDLSNLRMPREVNVYDSPGIARDVYVKGNYAYLADGPNDLQTFDLSDPSEPRLVGRFDIREGYTGISAESVFVADGHAYLGYDAYRDADTGLRIIDVSSPTGLLRQLGFYQAPGNPSDVFVSGGYAYLASGCGGVRIIDVSNPRSPERIGHYTRCASDIHVDGNYLYVADGPYGLRMVDVSDPTAPSEIASYSIPGFANRVFISGNYVYLVGEEGLYIFRVR